ncbi:MAG: UDP-N-acetylmuramoyl-L-alanine--D-glutamate ligase [Paludibacteraceae bacterium]|nr:UDP-N-acetylmuramoyl-L-alanine--D-glutamate ligase [Paludibacteraceae bacterium]
MDTKQIVVLGAGESGTGAAILAQAKGMRVFVSDSGSIKPAYKALLDTHHILWEENGHTEDKVLAADEVIKSPGIPETAPLIVALRDKGVPVISEIEFAARYTDAKMICITGSNGKTTTTSLIYDMLRRAGLDVGLAGNIGNSLALQVAREDHAYYVIELSSFQLDNMYDFRADIAILLNITPDHLDRYDFEFQNYVNAKFRITRNQTERDAFIYWSEDPVIDREIARIRPRATLYPFGSKEKHNVAFTDGEHLVVAAKKEVQPLEIPLEQLALQGKHNQLNSMAASIAAQLLDIKNDTIRESLRCFAGVPHRLQYVATVKGVRYINDSKATNVNSCWYALEAMTTPTVLILGGKDKGNDYSEIDSLVLDKCHTLVFMGLHNEKLEEHFSKLGYVNGNEQPNAPKRFFSTHNLHDAVLTCADAARDGDTVLLSPCCASFDLFNSYEDRGDQFMNAVRHL